MANTKEKKGFRAGVYAVFAGIIVAVILVGLTIFAFTSRYTAFAPEKVAQVYTDTIVQSGDGYNAYKYTLVSKNQKFGDFIINAYMNNYVNEDAEQSEIIGTGKAEEIEKLDAIYSTMYDYYVELVNTVGFDDYDTLYNSYFTKLKEVRHEVIGDDFMNTEFMFGVFEANVAQYGESLTGTEEELASDGKTVVKQATVGKYQELYGDDYKLTTTVENVTAVSDVDAYVEAYTARVVKDIKGDAFKPLDCSNDISDVVEADVVVKTQDGTTVVEQKVYVVKIGNSWYVDNTNTNTSALYLAK